MNSSAGNNQGPGLRPGHHNDLLAREELFTHSRFRRPVLAGGVQGRRCTTSPAVTTCSCPPESTTSSEP